MRKLVLQLFLLTLLWWAAALLLDRGGFTLIGSKPFDWAGLLFMAVTISLAVYGFVLLRSAQRQLPHKFVYYGLAWIIPTILIGSVLVSALDSPVTIQPQLSSKECKQQLLPHTCSIDGDKTFQSGYGVSIIIGAGLVYTIYRGLKNKIKGHSHDELFK